MRAYMIAALAVLAMIAFARVASTQDQVIGAPYCKVDCLEPEVEADNGVGTTLPLDPNSYDDEDDRNRDQ
jgi:hypothetical protein